MRTLTLISLVLFAANSLGCNSMKWSKFRENVFNKQRQATFNEEIDPDTIPTHMSVIWHDATATKMGSTPTRGFGGRIYFYNHLKKPIEVNGELVVYGYDDTDDQGQRTSPDKKFVIEPEDFEKHLGESDLGTSYSVWIPWDRVGSFRKVIGLVPVFKTVDGAIVKGGHSVNILPGPVDPAKKEVNDFIKSVQGLHLAYSGVDNPKQPSHMQQAIVDYNPSTNNHVQYRNSRDTTTIPIPRDTQRRIDSMSNQTTTIGPTSQNVMNPSTFQAHQSQQLAQRMAQSGPITTKVVYGKTDITNQMNNGRMQSQAVGGQMTQSSFQPPAHMMNGATGNPSMSNVAQVQHSAASTSMQAGDPNSSGVTPAAFQQSTQPNMRHSEARRVFGQPGSYR